MSPVPRPPDYQPLKPVRVVGLRGLRVATRTAPNPEGQLISAQQGIRQAFMMILAVRHSSGRPVFVSVWCKALSGTTTGSVVSGDRCERGQESASSLPQPACRRLFMVQPGHQCRDPDQVPLVRMEVLSRYDSARGGKNLPSHLG